MLTMDDIAVLEASARLADENPRRAFQVTPAIVLELITHLRIHRDKSAYLAGLNPRQFAELFQQSLRGESMDELIAGRLLEESA